MVKYCLGSEIATCPEKTIHVGQEELESCAEAPVLVFFLFAGGWTHPPTGQLVCIYIYIYVHRYVCIYIYIIHIYRFWNGFNMYKNPEVLSTGLGLRSGPRP